MRISVEINQPRWLASRPRLRKGIFVAAILGLFVIPGTVIASHQFADVPDSQPFHTEIDWMKDNAITQGSTECGTPPPGQEFYCPESSVRRDAIAAFLYRVANNQVVDAGKLDGLDSTNFASVTHAHNATEITSGTLSEARFSAYSDLTQEGRLDNSASSDLLTRGQLDSRYLNLTGGTLSGAVSAPDFLYTSPRAFSHVIPFTAMNTGSNIRDYHYSDLGAGGESGTAEDLYAPVELPDGATITSVRFWFYDASPTTNLFARIFKYPLGSSSFNFVADAFSSGNPGFQGVTDSTIISPFVDNDQSLMVLLVSPSGGNWDSDLAIQAVVINYTLPRP